MSLTLTCGEPDGRTIAAGAVSGLKGYPNAVSVARRVMTDLPHVLLAGSGADRFAAECGFPPAELLTEEARRTWRERIEGKLEPNSTPGDVAYYDRMKEWVRRTLEPTLAADTVNFIARDREGNIASAASTSGWAWKYPGRAADSCMIGGGNYADNRYGAACCTGRGEMAIRAATARSVVLYLKTGMSLTEALTEAQRDLWSLDDPYYSTLNIVALDADGGHGAATNGDETYIYITGEMDHYLVAPRLKVTRATA